MMEQLNEAQQKLNHLHNSTLLGDMSARWSWRCFFGIHRGTKWSDPEGIETALIHQMRVQRRACVNCNRMQVRALVIQQRDL